ncbi:MAG: hypothetical protein AB1746_09750 [Candidatus Zixiibacteriota bacterium]
MSEERMQILKMLAEGKITAEQAEKLLDAIGEKSQDVKPEVKEEKTGNKEQSKSGEKPKCLRIMVTGKHGKGDNVNIRIPLQLIRAGVKMKSLLPFEVREKLSTKMKINNVDWDIKNMDEESMNDFFKSLKEMSIDIDEDDETVKIFCE